MADTEALAGVRRALVVGLGTSGRVAVGLLAAAGVEVVATDDRADVDTSGLQAQVRVGHDAVALLDEVDLVVPSPGVPEHAPVLRAAAERGLPIWSEPELGWRLHPRRVVAITGTNGKTSVTELVARMLTVAGIEAVACGNIGRAFGAAAAASTPDTTLVAELSSFQLRFCHALRPTVGVLLNLAPDHLDWHGDETSYGAAKARMWRAQRGDDWAVVNQQDDVTLALAEAHAPAGVATFDGSAAVTRGVGREGADLVARVAHAAGPLVAVADLVPDAPHHHANVAAAATAALLVGADPEAVAAAAREYRPGHHRLERVAEHDGVVYVDDSKATNPHAAAAALESFGSVVWIAGGIAKGVDLGVLEPSLGRVRHAVLIGESADDLAAVCSRAGVDHETASSMEDAVARARATARPGDTVLLAPACSSFDMFRDYADRGDRFAAAARGRASEEVR